MLEGLEAVGLRKSTLADEVRIDAELYNKYLVSTEKKIRTLKHTTLANECTVLKKGIFDIRSDCYTDDGVPFVRISNLKGMLIDTNEIVYIPEEEHSKNFKTALNYSDIILSKTATAAASFVDLQNCNTSQDTVAIKLKKNSELLSEYLVVFLNTDYGLKSTQRWFTGNIQMHLNLDNAKNNLFVPVFSNVFQQKIKETFYFAIQLDKQSQSFYTIAENLLLQELGLSNRQPTVKNTTTKTLKESFLESGRIDAEYYQELYYEVENKIKSKGFSLVQDICSEINYGTVPTSPYTFDGTGIPYIKGMNLKNCQVAGDLDLIINTEELSERFYTKEGDIIISQMGTVGDVGVINEKQVGWLFASFTIRIRLKDQKKFDPYFVGFYIQKVAKEYYLLRNVAQASVRQNTDLPTIKKMYIPNIEISTQQIIAEKIQESFRLQKQSKDLLEAAKTAVEIAIEQDEQTALNYLKNFKDTNATRQNIDLCGKLS